jgi:hypothetical protein
MAAPGRLLGANDATVHTGSEVSTTIQLRGRINWTGPTVPPSQYADIRSYAYSYVKFNPNAVPPNPRGTTSASVQISPTGPITYITDHAVEKWYTRSSDWKPTAFNSERFTSGSSSAQGRGMWRDDPSPTQEVNTQVTLFCQITVRLNEYYERTQVAVYHGPPVLTRAVQRPITTVVSGTVVLSTVVVDGRTYTRITNATGSPQAFSVRSDALSLLSTQDNLWVCGFVLGVRGTKSGTPLAVSLGYNRDGASLTGTAQSAGSVGTGLSWYTVGGPRNVFGHSQTSNATWRLNQLGSGYIYMTGTLPAGESIDVQYLSARFYLVPRRSRSILEEEE